MRLAYLAPAALGLILVGCGPDEPEREVEVTPPPAPQQSSEPSQSATTTGGVREPEVGGALGEGSRTREPAGYGSEPGAVGQPGAGQPGQPATPPDEPIINPPQGGTQQQ